MLAFIGRISDLELALYIAVGAVLLMWFSIILWSIFSTSYREWKKDRESIIVQHEIDHLSGKCFIRDHWKSIQPVAEKV